MKIITFKYTKADGKISQRTIVVSNEPSKFVSGTDISELEDVDQVQYVEEVKKAKEIYLDMLKQINDEFDVIHNYRQFKPECMSDIKVV
jgi:hypothetical protein